MRRFYFILLVLFLPILITACGGEGGEGGTSDLDVTTLSGVTDGPTLYAAACAECHGALATTGLRGRSAAQLRSAIDNVGRMSNLKGLSADQVQAIADALNDTTSATPTPTPTPDGAALYASNCAGCHGPLASSSKTDRTAAQIAAAINADSGGMGSLTLDLTQVQAIADALSSTAGVTPPAVVTPTPTIDGVALYASNCAGCHSPLASSTKTDRTATQITSAINANSGGMGSLSLTAAEIQAIADALASGTPGSSTGGGADFSDCTACHSQPPDGTTFPNTAGAHAAHQAIGSIGTNCDICHLNHAHNGTVDLAFPATYSAAGSVATDNLDGTCGNISCHGGKTTPDWWTGSIDLTSQCTACHSSGSAQYISYNSGRHSKHSGRSCTACHNGSRMSSHIGNLTTTSFETTAASTIGGSGTDISSYDANTQRCVGCHGSATW